MSSTTPTSTASPSASTTAAAGFTAGTNLKVVGVILAITSGVLIGSSFVFKKKGLLRAQAGQQAGEGVAYLKSPLWWLGMIMMILGELCNFAAYAFVEALVVTPLGALSVVICAILSSIFLKEKLTFFGWLGCALCIMGSVIIALNGPKEESVGHIKDFQKLFLSPGFLVWTGLLIAISLVIIFFFAPKYGKKSMLWYIMVCSMIGGISVSVTTGLGAAIVTTASGENQFKFWFIYFLMAFVVITLITEVYYLNMALALFNTAMVTPTYYVIFTFFSMVTTVVLFKGLKATAAQIITIAMAFFIICVGITVLQMSKVDPVQLSKLDRKSTILLQASKNNTEGLDEKDPSAIEDPGIDTLRGSFGAVGSIIRARSAKRMSQSSRTTSYRSRLHGDPEWGQSRHHLTPGNEALSGLKRHQLWDAPMPPLPKSPSIIGSPMQHRTTIKFDEHDLVHQYAPPGSGGINATHYQQRSNSHSQPTNPPGMPYPPTASSRIDTDASTVGSDSTVKDAHRNPFSPVSEPEIRTAPPTSQPNQLQLSMNEMGLRKESLYSDSPASTTLLTFPSVTDSARSSDPPYHDPFSDSRWKPGKKEHRYPKGTSQADDEEESVGLWRRDGARDSDDERPSMDYGGSPTSSPEDSIRLVTSPSNRYPRH